MADANQLPYRLRKTNGKKPTTQHQSGTSIATSSRREETAVCSTAESTSNEGMVEVAATVRYPAKRQPKSFTTGNLQNVGLPAANLAAGPSLVELQNTVQALRDELKNLRKEMDERSTPSTSTGSLRSVETIKDVENRVALCGPPVFAEDTLTTQTVIRSLGFTDFSKMVQHFLGDRMYLLFLLPRPAEPSYAWLERCEKQKPHIKQALKVNGSALTSGDVFSCLKRAVYSVEKRTEYLNTVRVQTIGDPSLVSTFSGMECIEYNSYLGSDYFPSERLSLIRSMSDGIEFRDALICDRPERKVMSYSRCNAMANQKLSDRGILSGMVQYIRRTCSKPIDLVMYMCEDARSLNDKESNTLHKEGRCHACTGVMGWMINQTTPMIVHPHSACRFTNLLVMLGFLEVGSKTGKGFTPPLELPTEFSLTLKFQCPSPIKPSAMREEESDS